MPGLLAGRPDGQEPSGAARTRRFDRDVCYCADEPVHQTWCPKPAEWARSQAAEGIPQLARFLFLRQAWRFVVAEGDRGWIEEQTKVDHEGPGGGIGPALNRALLCGVSQQDLTTIVRVMQWKLLSELCCLLDDPGDIEDEAKDVAWGLFQVDEDGKPISAMVGLQESVLETEPSGREMRSN